ncbi:MAG: tetratricopeptide repeat protein [Armatimonadota bacterium]|nr:tetratricopeptide repeat protein [Armatimonadota bacterium]MCX7776968.1 tetratricopeptide repeat protein [Armatimonadota bacterium]MDW8024802.1 tetratricopeptide repeat protein [Armatimonadota bacterium]
MTGAQSQLKQLILQATQLLKSGRASEAAELLQRAVHSNPNSFVAHHALGVALAQCGKLEEALIHLRQAVHMNPKSPQVHFNMGRVYQKQGKLKEALDEFGEAVRLNPQYVAALKAIEEVQQEISMRALEEAPLIETEPLELVEETFEHVRCHWHPDKTPTLKCPSCNRWVCGECERFIFGMSMCFECAEKERAKTAPKKEEGPLELELY